MRAKKTLKIIGLIVFIAAVTLMVLPWKPLIAKKLIQTLEQKGIHPVVLTVESIGTRGLTVKDISIGEPALKLAQVTVGYAPRALLRGEIAEVTVQGLQLNVTQNANSWQVDGLESLLAKPAQPEEKAKPTNIPTSKTELAFIPVGSIGLAESNAHITASGWQVEAPLALKLTTTGTPTFTFESTSLTASKGPDGLSTGKITLDLTLDEATKQWHGKWSIADITLTSESLVLPKLQAAGEATLTADTITLTGKIADASKAYHANFTVDYSLSKPEKSLAVISPLSMPWGGGTIGASKIQLPIGTKKSTTLTLNVKQVPIESLLKALTNGSATATGVVSGTLPLTITADGNIKPGKGSLRAEEPGTISMPPDTIPGDNQQVTLVRDVLKNLHYTLLSLDLDTADDNTLSVTLAVEGNNPEVEKGRPVKLKVHLSGDLLNLITQNLKLMTDPTQFIKQESHEKN